MCADCGQEPSAAAPGGAPARAHRRAALPLRRSAAKASASAPTCCSTSASRSPPGPSAPRPPAPPARPGPGPFPCSECRGGFGAGAPCCWSTRRCTRAQVPGCTECGGRFSRRGCCSTGACAARGPSGARVRPELPPALNLTQHRAHPRAAALHLRPGAARPSARGPRCAAAPARARAKPFACPECGGLQPAPKAHAPPADAHGRKPYRCRECGLGFHAGLPAHRAPAHPHGRRPFACPVRPALPAARQPPQHRRIHTGERPCTPRARPRPSASPRSHSTCAPTGARSPSPARTKRGFHPEHQAHSAPARPVQSSRARRPATVHRWGRAVRGTPTSWGC